MSDGGVAARALRAYRRRDYLGRVEEVRRVCRRLEAGETLAEACRGPDMPGRTTVLGWIEGYAELKAMVEAALALAARAHPPRRDYHRLEPEVAEAFLERVREGRGLDEICTERDMPALSTVHRWRRENPDFEQAYRAARQVAAEALFDLAMRVAFAARPGEVGLARLKVETLRWRIAKLAPHQYGRGQPGLGQLGSGKMAAAKEKAGAQGRIISVEVRSFVPSPCGRHTLELTRAVRGMSAAEREAFTTGIQEGRISLDEAHAMNRAKQMPGEPPLGDTCVVSRGGPRPGDDPEAMARLGIGTRVA